MIHSGFSDITVLLINLYIQEKKAINLVVFSFGNILFENSNIWLNNQINGSLSVSEKKVVI